MGKTRAFMQFSRLRNLVSDSMAIDMGSASTIIAVRGRGIVIDEPSVIAVDKVSGEAVAVGQEAHNMQGREARNVVVIAPLVDGVVADFERTQQMLAHFVRKARSGISYFSRRACMSVLSEITQVEQRALLAAAENASIGRVYMVEEGLAAAIGAGVSITDQRAYAIVDVGGGTTNIAVVAQGTPIHARAERIGSSDIDVAIMDRIRRYRGLSIGLPSAERLKVDLGEAIEPSNASRSIQVKGRDVQTGRPEAIDVSAGEIYAVLQPIIRRIAEEVRDTLAELAPEVAADIYERGLILTGGGAMLNGLAEYLARETKLQVQVADQPRLAIVRGLLQLFDMPLLLRRVAKNESLPLLEAEE
jgi:rod shape-determining protein MreB and related proteins